jgi:hypothetical protein
MAKICSGVGVGVALGLVVAVGPAVGGAAAVVAVAPGSGVEVASSPQLTAAIPAITRIIKGVRKPHRLILDIPFGTNLLIAILPSGW